MKEITEDYVSFETAKLLNEKGFKQECDYATSWYAKQYYKNSCQGEWFEGEHQIIDDIDDKCNISYLSDKNIFIPAPTLQMAMKWLMETYNLHISVFVGTNESSDADGEIVEKWSFWTYLIETTYGNIIYDAYAQFDPTEYQSYEEACEAAIKYTLENLI